MRPSTGEATRRRDRVVRAAQFVLFASAVLVLTMPRSAAWLMPLAAFSLLWAGRAGLSDLRAGAAGSAAARILLLFAAYALATTLWSLDPGDALAKLAGALAFLLLTLTVLQALPRAGDGDIEALALAFVLGATAGALLFAFESVGGQTLAHGLRQLGAALGGEIAEREIVFADLNRNAGLLVLFLWPALLAVRGLSGAPLRIGLAGCLLVLCLVGIGASEHETSKLALASGALAFAVALLNGTLVRRFLMLAWVAAFVLVVPGALVASKYDLHRAEWLPQSAQARLILWNETASRVPEAPVLGIGLRSTRARHTAEGPIRELPPGLAYPPRTGRHAHNVFLQTWFELGLAGALLLAAAGVMVLRGLRGLPGPAQPFALAQFAAFSVLAAATWDMWQSWLLAGVGLSVVYFAVAMAQATRKRT